MREEKPRLGFAGAGWIGESRLKAIAFSGAARIEAVMDPDQAIIKHLQQEWVGMQYYDSFEALAEAGLDGIVIASPSALHAGQALYALKNGNAVFCQKPLGRNARETEEVVNAARNANLLLGVDFSYRGTRAVQHLRKVLRSGRLGRIYGVRLAFHNAWGPGKPWYYDPELSGGGCLTDLGIHLIDLLYNLPEKPVITKADCSLLSKGKPAGRTTVEDYVNAQMELDNGASVQLSCSWNLPAGRNALIEATFYGEYGGVSFRNINGSFYDFTTEYYEGTTTEVLVSPPDEWGGRAAILWTEELAAGGAFNPEAETYVEVARILDLLYECGYRETESRMLQPHELS